MALRGIQEYIARDVNNIARVEDEVLLASRAIYSCIPRKRAIQYYYYYYYSYRALCVILLSNDRGWRPAAILSSHEKKSLWDVATVMTVGGA